MRLLNLTLMCEDRNPVAFSGFPPSRMGVKLSKIPIRPPSLSLPVNGEGTHFPPLRGGRLR